MSPPKSSTAGFHHLSIPLRSTFSRGALCYVASCRAGISRTSRAHARAVTSSAASSGKAAETKTETAEGDGEKMGHTPVLVSEVLSYVPKNAKTVIDCTLGGGGHARAILSANPTIERYIGIDLDACALSEARKTIAIPPLETIHGNYADMRTLLTRDTCADVIVLDAGMSSMQLDDASRGFSFTRDGPLDMRMNASGSWGDDTAAEWLARVDEATLSRVIWEFGEDRAARRIASAIVKERNIVAIESTAHLAKIVERVKGGRGRIHAATKTFQAIRIVVNDELNGLQRGLHEAVNRVRRGSGRLVVISFHSLEDRIVKRTFRELSAVAGGVRVLTKRPVVSSREEMAYNVRCRSAKMRVVQRLDEGEVPVIGKVNKYKAAASS